jgi:glycosyltransferase involved in cell wall biosynthesis
VQPRNGIFVEQRLRQLLRSGEMQVKVVAPVPWFPSSSEKFGVYSKFAKVPSYEVRHDIEIFHPRFPVIPKVGMTLAPFLMAWFVRAMLRKIQLSGYDFDAIDAHYFYPDGVAATMLGRRFQKPVFITARGTDVNVIPNYRLPRKLILRAAIQCSQIITVSEALKKRLVEIGVFEDKISVLKNGVDLTMFDVIDREKARRRLDIKHGFILTVGNLVEEKGHDLVITALKELNDKKLIIIGSGHLKNNLLNLAKKQKVNDRVQFVDNVSQEQLKYYYNAAELLVLASTREGMPNVLLESLACGTPVIASNVGGVPEVICAEEAGIIMQERTVPVLTKAINTIMDNYPQRAKIRKYAERFDWSLTVSKQVELMKTVVGC